MVSECAPDSDATVKIIRKGAIKTFTVRLGELPGENGKNESAQTSNSSTNDALDGVTVTDLDPQTRDQLQIPADIKGALVSDVSEDSNAADAGLQKGDVIIEINQQPVTSSDEAIKFCAQAKTDRLLLEIWRREGDMATTTYLSVDNTKRK